MNRLKSLCSAILLVSLGVTSASAAEKPPVVGDEAKDFELATLDGTKVRLSKLTEGGPVVVVVLRGWPGYQCPLCTKQMGELLGKADQIKQSGAKVVLIYPGPASDLENHAKEFIEKKTLPEHFLFVTDPDYSLTNSYGLRWDAPKETAYPSTFVVDAKRKVLFAKISKTHGDRAKTDDVLKALPAK